MLDISDYHQFLLAFYFREQSQYTLHKMYYLSVLFRELGTLIGYKEMTTSLGSEQQGQNVLLHSPWSTK